MTTESRRCVLEKMNDLAAFLKPLVTDVYACDNGTFVELRAHIGKRKTIALSVFDSGSTHAHFYVGKFVFQHFAESKIENIVRSSGKRVWFSDMEICREDDELVFRMDNCGTNVYFGKV